MFLYFNLTAVRALTKVTIFYCELGIAVYFCERIGRQYKIFVLDQFCKWYVRSQRACMKDEDHSETYARHL